jgi:hypothetical protein
MVSVVMSTYILILSHSPADIFTFFNVKEINGISMSKSANLSGWTGDVPAHYSGPSDEKLPKRFIFINLSACDTDYNSVDIITKQVKKHSKYAMNTDVDTETNEILELVKALK